MTYTTGVTASGSIVAELVTANIITADMVNTGILSSAVGNSWFNLDTGVLRISHGGVQYSQMDTNGFSRKYNYGDAQYLSGIYVHKEGEGNGSITTQPNDHVIPIPQSFAFRTDVKAFVSLDSIYMFPELLSTATNWTVFSSVMSMNLNTSYPTITVRAYLHIRGGAQNEYYPSGFSLVVIGG